MEKTGEIKPGSQSQRIHSNWNDELCYRNEKTQKKYGLTFDFYTCDAIALKTIERGNQVL
jgi:hypothetical protein